MKLLANTITILQRGQQEKHSSCYISKSKFVIKFLNGLTEFGLINGFLDDKNKLKVFLKYNKFNVGYLENIKIYSQAGCRRSTGHQYKGCNRFSYLVSNRFNYVYYVTEKYCRNKNLNKNLGGEILCRIYFPNNKTFFC